MTRICNFAALFVCVNLLQFGQSDDEVKGKVFSYPGKAKSEQGLSTCEKGEVCSIVHKRFWFPRTIERFCNCHTNDYKECSSTWSDTPDNFTMNLNNRAQMKFCEPITDLPNCLHSETHVLHVLNHTVISTSTPSNDDEGEQYRISSKAECYCPPHHRWMPSKFETAIQKYTNTTYRCVPLPHCKPDEFCGFERADYYSVYYHCSCPVGHLCLRHNDFIYNSKELFYEGVGFHAYCTKFPTVEEVTHNTN